MFCLYIYIYIRNEKFVVRFGKLFKIRSSKRSQSLVKGHVLTFRLIQAEEVGTSGGTVGRDASELKTLCKLFNLTKTNEIFGCQFAYPLSSLIPSPKLPTPI